MRNSQNIKKSSVLPNPESKIGKKKRNIVKEKKRISKNSVNDGFRDNEPNGEKKGSIITTSSANTSEAMKQAVELSKNLKNPSFAKFMTKSHVTQGFWLGIPKSFCYDHLPDEDGEVNVVLKSGTRMGYDTKYLRRSTGLSGGWKRFAAHHRLVEGDALVFELVKACFFKVYIKRMSDFTKNDAALSISSLDVLNQPITDTQMEDQDKYEDPNKLSSDEETNDSHFENMKGITLADHKVTFEEIKSFDDFKIEVDSRTLDTAFESDVRERYYELCNSQNKFLHESLIQGLSIQLVIGIIGEIVAIADAIGALKPTASSKSLLEGWDKKLELLRRMGMSVSFMHDMIQTLLVHLD